MKARILESFYEGDVKFHKGETVPVFEGGKEPKGRYLNSRRFKSLKNRGKVKGAK